MKNKIIPLCIGFIIGYIIAQVLPMALKNKELKSLNKQPIEHARSKSVCDEILKGKVITPIQKFDGTPAKVNFSSRPEAKSYYTRITEDVAEGPNFAGHYRFVEWGCGTECIGYAIVDLITGMIIDLEFAVEQQYPWYFIDSRMLVFNSKEGLTEYRDKKLEELITMDNYDISYGREYYELVEETNGSAWLHRLCTENAYDGIFSY